MFGVTSDSPLNTYSAGKHLDSRLDSQCGGSSVSFRSYSQVSFTRRMVALSRFIFIAMILSSVPQLLHHPLVVTCVYSSRIQSLGSHFILGLFRRCSNVVYQVPSRRARPDFV